MRSTMSIERLKFYVPVGSPLDGTTFRVWPESGATTYWTDVKCLEGESLEIIPALGLHEDTEHEKVLAHVRALVKEHAEMRMVIDGHRFNKENP